MVNSPTVFMSVLGLPETADERAVRKAYARLLKQIDQANDLDGFQHLRQAYELALAYARARSEEHSQAAAAADQDPSDPGAADSGSDAPEGSQPADDIAPPEEHGPIDQGAQESTPDVAVHDVQPTTGSEEAAPFGSEAPAPFDSEEPERAAENAFQAFLRGRPQAPAFWRVDAAKAALSQALDEPRLINLQSKMVFEACLVQYLLAGWQPGHEELLTASAESFDWETDPQRLARFGWAGAEMESVLTQRAAFASLPSKWQEQERKLIELLRKGNPKPSLRFLAAKVGPLRKLVSEFPNWLAVVAPVKTLEAWEQLANAKLVGISDDVAAEPSSLRTLAHVVFFLIFTPLFFVALLLLKDCSGGGFGTAPQQRGFEADPRGSMQIQPRHAECRAMLAAEGSAMRLAAENKAHHPDRFPPDSDKLSRHSVPDQQAAELPAGTEHLTAAEKDFAKALVEAGRRVGAIPSEVGTGRTLFFIDGRPCELRPAPVGPPPIP